MSTRVETNRTNNLNPANDLLKVLPPKTGDLSSPQPFKKELDKAQRAADKPKPEAKAEAPEKKKPARAEKKSDAKAKKPAKQQDEDADEQPIEEADAKQQAKNPQDGKQESAKDAADELDGENPGEHPKVKANPKASDKPIDPTTLALATPEQRVATKDDAKEQADTPDATKKPQQTQVRAVQAADAEKPKPADEKANAAQSKKTTDDAADGKIDLSQLDDSQSDDDVDETSDAKADAKTADKPTAVADATDDDHIAQTAVRPEPKVAPLDSQTPVIQPVAQQDQQATSAHQQATDSDSDSSDQSGDAAQMLADVASAPDEKSSAPDARAKMTAPTSDAAQFASLMPKTPATTTVTKPAAPAPPPPEAQFAAANHDKIITSLKTELLPNGGTMHIRLDPPELGALQVKVSMQDGVMTASFETSNDDATKLLSHSLTQLKHALESQGVSVDKLHVQQSPRNESSSNQKDENGNSHSQTENHRSAQQEQQRKEMIRRMWAKLGVMQDPLDMVA